MRDDSALYTTTLRKPWTDGISDIETRSGFRLLAFVSEDASQSGSCIPYRLPNTYTAARADDGSTSIRCRWTLFDPAQVDEKIAGRTCTGEEEEEHSEQLSIGIDWLPLTPSTAEKLTEWLNGLVANLSPPDFLCPLRIQAIGIGDVAPEVEIVDIRDVSRSFRIADGESHPSSSPECSSAPTIKPDEDGFSQPSL
ncbi:Mitochondrial distribution and morphology protein 12 [Puccinia graminis f. sp. tritici]|uniref:Mitochondrial distribution and morphology protein 12 n=1 Tax=Puccinia graminis f. sp. tritici TaxID=56615 RepID=A0A5B0RMJ0_PUCGR|nr:Mitochondrial distribution and morphology protein 12 [Puccinia graminis f. sp. tritici]KAA1126649.1 Mitochondrial distribution and morphology protein 12 [Puccinia graminis f. sp. tritici]